MRINIFLCTAVIFFYVCALPNLINYHVYGLYVLLFGITLNLSCVYVLDLTYTWLGFCMLKYWLLWVNFVSCNMYLLAVSSVHTYDFFIF